MTANSKTATVATIPLVEEVARLETHSTVRERVQVSTSTEMVDASIPFALMSESVEIKRVKIGKIVDSAPSVRTEDGVTIVPVVEEVAVVEKRLMLVEEIHLLRHSETELVDIPVTLRKQRALVTRTGSTSNDRGKTDDNAQ